jgi:hypothetical protein
MKVLAFYSINQVKKAAADRVYHNNNKCSRTRHTIARKAFRHKRL